jgi:hypothetical protein
MKDEFDDLLDRWLRDRGASDRATIRALAGNVATLPPRRRRRPPALAAAAAVAIAVGLAAFALMPRTGSVSASPSVPVPPDPAAFTDDPRLAQCGASVDAALYAFEMAQARDYWLHLPAMGLSPELDVDAPGFVVIYRSIQPFGVTGAPAPDGQPREARTTVAPGRHDLCVLIGANVATAERNIYSDVDISGLTVEVASLLPSDGPRPTRPPDPTPPPSPTPEPLPAWAADAADALECTSGPWPGGPSGPMDTQEDARSANAALSMLLAFNRTSLIVWPGAGFQVAMSADRAVLFTYVVDRRVKAAVVATIDEANARRWWTSSVASCDPSEYDPGTPLSGGGHVWTDLLGNRLPTTQVFERADCYGATQLLVQGLLYLRDPTGQAWDPALLDAKYAARATLPTSASDLGYRDGSRRMWAAADGSSVFIGGPTGIERWPHVKGDDIQRTDCN